MQEDQQTAQQVITRLKILFEGEQEKVIELKVESDIQILLDYQGIKKKILQEYKYVVEGRDKILVFIENFYPKANLSIPIYTSRNYCFMIKDMLDRGVNLITLKITKIGQLRRRRERSAKVEVQFDSDGSVQSAQNNEIIKAIKANTPVSEPYKDACVVKCMFCNERSTDKEVIRRAGPFYGPFINKHYAHLMCLLWCSKVSLSDECELQGIKQAIDDTRNAKCSYCHQKGASFYCHEKNCKSMAGHFRCAMDNGWYFNWQEYRCYCPKCTKKGKAKINISSSSKTRTLTCNGVALQSTNLTIPIKAETEIKNQQLINVQFDPKD